MPLDGLEQVGGSSGPHPPGPGETHVWAYATDLDPPALAGLRAVLSPEEIERSQRLRNPRASARFIAGRAQLRLILGDYLQSLPASLEFSSSAAGKPSLAVGDRTPRLHFNATGSGSLAIVALRTDGEVGVDVEEIRPLPDVATLARRLLRADEYREFAELPEARRRVRLYDYWVRKEAAVKALGSGMRQAMNRVALHPWPGDAAHRIEAETTGLTRDVWVIRLPVPLAGYTAAVASTQPFGPILSAWREPPQRSG